MFNNKFKYVKFFIVLLIGKEKYISVKILYRKVSYFLIYNMDRKL